MSDHPFEVGAVYYEFRAWGGTHGEHIISSWIYEGEDSSRSGQVGFRFVEHVSWSENKFCQRGPLIRRTYYPLESAQLVLLTWRGLLDQLTALCKFQRAELKYIDPVRKVPVAAVRIVEAMDRSRIDKIDTATRDVAFSIRGYLLEGEPLPGMQAIVLMGPSRQIRYPVVTVRQLGPPNSGEVLLVLGGQLPMVESDLSNLVGRFMELFAIEEEVTGDKGGE